VTTESNPHKAALRSAARTADICRADAAEIMELALDRWREGRACESLMFCQAAAASLLFARKMRVRAHYFR
jgi:hypothetical protein